MSADSLSRAINFSDGLCDFLVIDDCSSEGLFQDYFLSSHGLDPAVRFIRNEVNLGFVKTCNFAFSDSDFRDVVLLNSDVFVSSGWLDGLIRAGMYYPNVGTVTALTNNGSIAEVAIPASQISNSIEDLSSLNLALRKMPKLPPPLLPTGVGHCMLIKASVLSICGHFDEVFSPGYGEEVDLCRRASNAGFLNVLAPDVFVYHLGSQTFAEKAIKLRLAHDLILNRKHPGYLKLVQQWEKSNDLLLTSKLRVQIACRGLNVLIDARSFSSQTTGTSKLIEGFIDWANSEVDFNFTMIVEGLNEKNTRLRFPKTKIISTASVYGHLTEFGKFDVVFRPNQVSSIQQLRDLFAWAERVSIFQLDFISYNTPNYFGQVSDFYEFQRVTEITASTVDAVFSLSTQVQEFLESLEPRKPQSGMVTYMGLESAALKTHEKVSHQNSLLIYGAAFAHKNRTYAIKLVQEIAKTLPQVSLKLIGPDPDFGSSKRDELRAILETQNVDIQRYSWVTSEKLNEMISNSDLVIYPSLIEGFGIVPFEAAKLGVPCIFPKNSSLGETLGNVPFELIFDSVKDAQSCIQILTNQKARMEQINEIDIRSVEYQWNIAGSKIRSGLLMVACSMPHLNRRLVVTILQNMNQVESKNLNLDSDTPTLYLKVRNSKFMRLVFPHGSRTPRQIKKILSKFGLI
jgi:GT2 family glycosyltransferase